MRFLILLLFVATGLHAADVIPADRLHPWTNNVGVKGGIPNWTNCITPECWIAWTNTAPTRAQIQAALDSAGDYQVVRLPAFTNTMDGSIVHENNYTELVGRTNAFDHPITQLDFASNGNQDGLFETDNSLAYPPDAWTTRVKVAVINGGCTNGSYQIFVANTTNNMVVDNIMVIDQLDILPYVTQGSQGHSYVRPGRFLAQTVVITNVTGNVVSFDPPLDAPAAEWSQSATPHAYTLLVENTHHIGIRNLKVSRTDGGDVTFGSFHFANGHNKWLKNVWSTQGRLSHAWLYYAVFCEVRDSYFTLADQAQPSTYTIRPTMATHCLIENNIATNVFAFVSGDPSVGCVYSYNFVVYFPWNSFPDSMPEIFFNHGGHSRRNLFEGNWSSGKFIFDSYHGSSSYYFLHRNRWTGWDIAAFDGATIPIDYDDGGAASPTNLAAYVTIVGNVLGMEGHHTTVTNGGSFSIYDSMIWNPNVTTNSLILGNYNVVDDGIPARETLGSDTNAPSYYLTAKPAWWGNLEWPPRFVDDLDDSTKIPAGYRWLYGSNAPAASGGGGGSSVVTLNARTIVAPGTLKRL